MILSLLAAVTLAPARADTPISEADLRAHIAVLASDEYEGRRPGTDGGIRTAHYIASAWARAGLRPAAGQGWYQAVPLVERAPGTARLALEGARSAALAPADVTAIGVEPAERLERLSFADAPPGAPVPAGVAGRVAIVRLSATPLPNFSLRRHREALAAAGAAAVLLLAPGAGEWALAQRQFGQVGVALAGARPATTLVMEAGRFDALRAQAGGEDIRLSGTIATGTRAYDSHNVIGRLPGTGADGEAVAITGHWDHLGAECRPEGAPDRICNGAVDNASGIAVMIEVAERLARGPRPKRDILFIATTAEESGLLGARHFVANPTVPLPKIVGLLNIDTIAIGPRGLPVSAVNRGATPIDALIDAAARAQGRPLDADLDANAFTQRQDGAAFTEAGVPAVMAGGSFADMALLQAFLSSTYHGPEDELTDALPLGGAAEDADLHVLLARALANPKLYPRPKR